MFGMLVQMLPNPRASKCGPSGPAGPTEMFAVSLFVFGSNRWTTPPRVLATQTVEGVTSTPIGSATVSIEVTGRRVFGSNRSSLLAPRSVIHRPVASPAIPWKLSLLRLSLTDAATVFVAGSIRRRSLFAVNAQIVVPSVANAIGASRVMAAVGLTVTPGRSNGRTEALALGSVDGDREGLGVGPSTSLPANCGTRLAAIAMTRTATRPANASRRDRLGPSPSRAQRCHG